MRTFLQYLKEVKQPELKKIGKYLNKFNNNSSKLHLNNIFGDKKRIAFPIKAADSRLTSFINNLKELNINLNVEDLKKGIITKKIETQRGIQERQLRLANYLNSLKKNGVNAEKIDKLIQDWSVIKDKLSNMDMGSEYSVVVSRYPLDILRMSDHIDEEGGEIESCHSPDGGWFHCAIKEAHIGGAVAYAVKTTDLEKINLQAKEIFQDKDRQVEGIVPTERVRLRRFHNEKKNLEILVPEIRTYPMTYFSSGSKIKKMVPGFHEAVVSWAKKVQSKDIAEINPQEDYKDFDLRGGAYQDNKSNVIWNQFFNVDVNGEKTSKDQSNNPNNFKITAAESLEREAEQWIRNHNLSHIEVDFNAHENNGQVWGSWQARLSFELDGSKFLEFPNSRTLNERPYTRSNEQMREESLIMYLQHMYDDIQKVNVRRADDQYVNFEFKLTDPAGDPQTGGEGQMHQFELFLDRISRVDDAYNDIEKHLIFWLSHNNYLPNTAKQISEQYTLRHFTIEASMFKQNPKYKGYRNSPQSSYEIHSEWFDIGDLSGITKEHANFFNFVDNGFLIRTPITTLPKFAQQKLFFKSGSKNQSWHYTSKVSSRGPLKLMLSSNKEMTEEDRLMCCFEFFCDYDENINLAKKTMAGISVIDRDWYNYVKIITDWWTQTKLQITKQG